MNRSTYLRIFAYISLVAFIILSIKNFVDAIRLSSYDWSSYTTIFTWLAFVLYLFIGPLTFILLLTVADNYDTINGLHASIYNLKKELKHSEESIENIAVVSSTTKSSKTSASVGNTVFLTKTHYFEKNNIRMFKGTKGMVKKKDKNKYLVEFDNGYNRVLDWVSLDEIEK